MDFTKTERKWQKRWEEAGIFNSEVGNGKKKKYYIAIVYPYMSGLLHLGHLFTYTSPEIMSRYKRMNGFNVHVKFGFHCTGSPIVTAAQRVKEKEKSQMVALKLMGVSGKDIKKFGDPKYWVDYFPKETVTDLKRMGFALDYRYTFKTTSLNPPYDAMIRWQFDKLREMGYVKKGRHPVIWCPKENVPVGDHARAEGEGETLKDFIWAKFKLKGTDLILMAGTTRPDALYGQTNLWVDPEATYKIVKVDDEKWVVGNEAIQKIKEQHGTAEIVGEIEAIELMGKWVKGPLIDHDIYILPAEFIHADVGSGIVYSALEDPVDLLELKKLQTNPELVKRFGLDEKVVAKLAPVYIIKVPGMGENLGEDIAKEFGIKSSEDVEKLEKAKGELNIRVFRKGVMRKNCGKCTGMTVQDAQEYLKKCLVKDGDAVMFYEMSGKVVCRCLTECIVKTVSDQWFIEYNDPKWKKLAHKCLDRMKIYPEDTKKQFDYVIDWLNRWACVREFGLGTRLPWDEKWLIESLSDSTIQMAYATISKYLEHPADYGFKADKLNDGFYDYVFLGKGNLAKIEKSTGIPKKMIATMRKDFKYWYPFDFRNSAKDLIQNHLTFCIFNHTALFPVIHWPKAYILNGRIMVNNEKMSKSKGNFFTMRELYEKHGSDAVRLTSAYAGEGINDANYDMNFLKIANKKLKDFQVFAKNNFNKGRENTIYIDNWFESMINKSIIDTTENIENMKFKSAVQTGFLDMQRILKWYLRRTNNNPNLKLIKRYIEVQTKLISPFTPHIAEEIWEFIGSNASGNDFVSIQKWPVSDRKSVDSKLELLEELVNQTIEDIRRIIKLVGKRPKKIYVYVAPIWKHEVYRTIMRGAKDKKRAISEIMKRPEIRKQGKDAVHFSGELLNAVGELKEVPSQADEYKALNEAINFIRNEIDTEEVFVLKEEDPKKYDPQKKARNAKPMKPAIFVE
jgi:leucyl-tRNA synthetase